jgi:hypothetical protein
MFRSLRGADFPKHLPRSAKVKPENQTCQVSKTWQVVVNRRPLDVRRDLWKN